MDTSQTCRTCGSPLGPDAPNGQCPMCLMKIGLSCGSVRTGGPEGQAFSPHTVEDLGRLFPQLEVLSLIGQGGMPAVDKALAIFKEGTVMSKGTTSSSGIVHSYFANIFGPPQYRQLHEAIAEKTFQAFFDKGIFVGQIRTRLGLSGWEKKGPVLAAQALLDLLVAGDQDKE